MKTNQSGATIVEAAITLPVFFLLLFGLFSFGLLMSSYQTMVDAAREGARYGVAPTAGGDTLPDVKKIAQRSCNYLTGTVLGGNKGCSKYTGGGSTPPAITSCTDAALTGNGAAEDIYVGAADTAAKEPYTVNGNNMDQKQVVVGIRRNVVVPMLNFTFRLKTCSSMRSENN